MAIFTSDRTSRPSAAIVLVSIMVSFPVAHESRDGSLSE